MGVLFSFLPQAPRWRKACSLTALCACRQLFLFTHTQRMILVSQLYVGGLLLYSPSCASFVSWWYIKQHHVKSLLALLTLYYSNPTCKWEIMKDLVQSLWTWESEEEAQRPFWPGDCFNGQLVLSLHSLELDSQIIHFTLNPNLSWAVFQ